MMPLVSVIIAVYNGSELIASALESIAEQTFQDWECIVCDDGSTDKTWEITKNIADNNSKIVPIRNNQNRGAAYARNRCIDIAKGKYIAIQDADDISYPTRLEEQVNFLDVFSDISVVGSYTTLSDTNSRFWGEIKAPEVPRNVDWLKGTQVLHASVMMRREDVILAGKYDERLPQAEDYDLFIRMVAKGLQIRTLPKPLYDVHWDLSDYLRKTKKYRWNEFRVHLRALRLLNIAPYYAIYLLKPVIVGVIPVKYLYRHHYKKLKRT
jgi:glycosyltransferase EpsE